MTVLPELVRPPYGIATAANIEAAVRAVAEAAVAARPLRGCGNRDLAKLVASVAVANGVYAHFDRADIRVRYNKGHKDKHAPLPTGLQLTRPRGDDAPAFDAVIDGLEAASNLIRTGPAVGDCTVALALVPRDSLPEIDTRQHARTLALPPGTGPGLRIDSDPGEIVDHVREDVGGPEADLSVSILQRTWNDDLAKRYAGTDATVRLNPGGDLATHLRAVIPVPAGAGVRISAGLGGTIEAILAAVAARSTGGTVLMQSIPKGLEMTPQLADTFVYDERRLIPSEDVLFVLAGVVSPPAGAAAESLLPGVRLARAGGQAWVHVLALSPAAVGPERFVVETAAGRAATVTRLGPDDEVDDVVVLSYLKTADIESRLAETDRGDVEYFQHWRGCFVPGLEHASERELLAILNRLTDRGRVKKDLEVTRDSSEYRVSWSA